MLPVGSTGAGPQRVVARIRPEAVEHNCARLRRDLAGAAELCAVVKSDGYGHGAATCARAAQAGGASWLAVATAGEAAELRQAGVDARLLVMGALTSQELPLALDAGAEVVAWTADFVRALANYQGPRPTQVHVKLDTGMGRLGTDDPREAWGLGRRIDAAKRLRLAGVMTHFATADELGDEHFPAQLERFNAFVADMRAEYVGLVAHAANSAATLRDPASHFDMVRCGVAIYGLDPFQQHPDEQELEPALQLESYVAAVKRFKPGQSAGYGRRWTAEEPTWVAVLPIGYGDGWRRALTNNCDVLIGGRRRPLVGTVSMDNITVALGSEPDAAVGDVAVLVGRQGHEHITAEEVARRLDTINYEVTCGLTRRVPRVAEA